jgi:hypothetical protein
MNSGMTSRAIFREVSLGRWDNRLQRLTPEKTIERSLTASLTASGLGAPPGDGTLRRISIYACVERQGILLECQALVLPLGYQVSS